MSPCLIYGFPYFGHDSNHYFTRTKKSKTMTQNFKKLLKKDEQFKANALNDGYDLEDVLAFKDELVEALKIAVIYEEASHLSERSHRDFVNYLSDEIVKERQSFQKAAAEGNQAKRRIAALEQEQKDTLADIAAVINKRQKNLEV